MLPTVPYSTLGAPSITPRAPWGHPVSLFGHPGGTQYPSQGTLHHSRGTHISLFAPGAALVFLVIACLGLTSHLRAVPSQPVASLWHPL